MHIQTTGCIVLINKGECEGEIVQQAHSVIISNKWTQCNQERTERGGRAYKEKEESSKQFRRSFDKK